ncbi:hypothetical protein HAX54_032572 [Datura stramonium]|uniref:Uncharacterized protein n=1 Tax=Datura stramonium TaxID=4076 RepID=A0ABS8VCF1_DATST|nr:hypothetical protein [Datura stramonium]
MEFPPAPTKLQFLFKAMPIIIMRHLWKRRNARRYGKDINIFQMTMMIQQTAQRFIKARYPWINLPGQWDGISTSSYKATMLIQSNSNNHHVAFVEKEEC